MTPEAAPEPALWAERAELAQDALTARFASRLRPGSMHNTSRPSLRHGFAFNYWWLAHAVEVRVDAFERSGDPRRLAEAGRVFARIRRRNGGSLFNDYFDDMGWLCLAALRLHGADGAPGPLADAVALVEHIAVRGWNTRHGASVSWRVQQPGYKNAPSNGVFAVAAARVAALTGDERMRGLGDAALDWLSQTLLRPGGLVVDGIGRSGGDDVDDGWLFSYNQGLYIGALLERFDRTGDAGTLAQASRTARAAIAALAPDGVFHGEVCRFDQRGGGDIGLFKGVFVRYLGLLIDRLAAGPERDGFSAFVRTATDSLWQHLSADGRAPDDWSTPPGRSTFLATQLSAVMATEVRARLDAPRPSPPA